MKYIIDLPEGHELAFSDGQQTKIIWPDKNEMVVFNNDCEDILKIGFTVKLTPYDESAAEQRGQEEAWKLACHLYNVSPDVTDVIYQSMNGGKGLGVALEMPYTEAKAEYDAWQEEKNKIKVGDEVYDCCVRGVVTYVDKDSDNYQIVAKDGTTYSLDRIATRKTGRHFSEVADLLEKMRNPDADH